MGLITPDHAEQRADAGREMPEPAEIMIADDSAKRMVNRPSQRGTVKTSQPAGNRRLFFHPGNLDPTADVEKVDGGPASFLHEAPPCLPVIVMVTTATE